MSEYWTTRPQPQPASPTTLPSSPIDTDIFVSEYDRHRMQLISQGADEEWQLELRRYLQNMPADVTRDTDIVTWWSVRARLHILFSIIVIRNRLQTHTETYPTLARIALDILPSQASSVPCERVFSSSKLTATDRRARLKAEIFEELQMLKATWSRTTVDLAQLNSEEIEEVSDEFEDLFLADEEWKQWDEEVVNHTDSD
jgi:hypothetical protein